MRKSRILKGDSALFPVAVVGLGKLGLSMAAAYAKRGCRVTGVDIQADWVARINRGECPIEEAEVPDLLKKYRGRLTATTDIEEAIRDARIVFIIVATPSATDGSFSNAQVIEAVRAVGLALRGVSRYVVVAITCTVMPGTTEGTVMPLLEETSGKRCGDGFGLVYNPEFIALGSVVRDLLNPDFVLIGECDRRAGNVMAQFYHLVTENHASLARVRPREAEIAKIALNCYCTTKIAFANMLAELAERVPGVDAMAIADALGLDSRIGRKYLSPGLGFGGPCFPRDNVAFRAFARSLGMAAPIPEAVHSSNVRQVERVVERAKALLPAGGRVAMLGLSYKPGTPVVEESQPLQIAKRLAAERKYTVSVYDPAAMDRARTVLGDSVEWAGSIDQCVEGADLCVLAMAWKEFQRINAARLKRLMKVPRVLDCWRCLDPAAAARLEYHAVGLGPRT